MSLYLKRLRFYYAFLLVYFLFQVIFLFLLRSVNEDSHTNALKILKLYKRFAVELNKNKKLDNSGLYKIVHLKELENKETEDITMISQCSSNHFPSLENLFRAWEGPVSVSIYSEVKNIERTLWDMARFIYCNYHRDFGMHLVVPNHGLKDAYVRDYKFPELLLSRADKSISCYSDYTSTENERNNYNWTSPYPVNLLRNVARTNISTDFVLVVDIDMIPSANLRSDFLDFVKKQQPPHEKAVYVVPVFETLLESPTPRDKAGLLRVIEKDGARPFYVLPCENCQKLTRYEEWLASENPYGTRVLYEVDWKHPWEPFFIAGRKVPDFDERFKQYGLNRVSQICELHVAGFKFLVLENLFLIHKGYKRPQEFHETKEKEMNANRRLYVRFKSEVRYKYPGSERRC